MNDILEQATINKDNLKILKEEASILLEYYETQLKRANNSDIMQSLENRIDRKKEQIEELKKEIVKLANYIIEHNNN